MIRTLQLIALTALLAAFSPVSAQAGWVYADFRNANGDNGAGILLEPSNAQGITLAFGCEGDRWRQVALLPDPADPLRLASDGKVSIGFSAGKFSPDGSWKVRNLESGRAYFAPAPTSFMGRLYRAEKEQSDATFYMRVRPAKKAPMTLEFPLAGLREALAKHLWKQCKLDVYFGDPE